MDENKVGIGTVNPNEALTVVGNISAVGTHTFAVSSNDLAPLTVTQYTTTSHGISSTAFEVVGGYYWSGSFVNTKTKFKVTNTGITEGFLTKATGMDSHAEGRYSVASGEASHAEGSGTTASGPVSHAEGSGTTASGSYGSHAEGHNTIAFGNTSHAQGVNTRAIGGYSHAAGSYSEARHDRTWIWKGSTDLDMLSTTRSDQFMVSAAGGSAFFGNVGIGTDDNSNALTVVGNISATGMLQLSLTSTPPSNTSTPAAWEDIQVGGVTYKIPLYL